MLLQAALRALMGQPLQAALQSALGEPQAGEGLLLQAGLLLPDAAQQGLAIRHQGFRRSRGRRRTVVGREVGEGEVDLVAYSRHHRHRAASNGAHDNFLVKRPEVF